MGLLAKLFEVIGGLCSSAASTACVVWVLDEPEMPRSLIEK